MMTLKELKDRAKVLFRGQPLDVARLLAAWAKSPGDDAVILEQAGTTPERFAEALSPALAAPDDADQIILAAAMRERSDDDSTVGDLLRALDDRPEHRLSLMLTGAGIDLSDLRDAVNAKRRADQGRLALAGGGTQALAYTTDLTLRAATGAFDDLGDRPDQVARVVEILARRIKANPILTGPPGSGKTALVQLLARDIARGRCKPLGDCRILEVNLGGLVGGTRYRGDFEERMSRLISAVEKDGGKTILFCDEVHAFLTAGAAQDVVTTASTLLKPALARGTIRLVGATTGEEYRRFIADADAAFARRLEEVRLEEPAPELTKRLVRAQAAAISAHHRVDISDVIAAKSIELSDRHVPRRHQPDKATTLLDSAAARAARRGEADLDEATLREVLAEQTGRPVELLSDDLRVALGHLEEILKRRVLFQDEAVGRIATCLVSARLGLRSRNRPLAVFLLVGDTGVGKTETARAIADVFFGGRERFLQIDLGEYADASAVSKLIGAPAGYEGSASHPGVLTGWLGRHESGVICLDEVEKAAPEVKRLLLGLLDEGRLTSGREVGLDARDTVIVLTTNALSAAELRRRAPGFGGREVDPQTLLERHFPPELLARAEILVYRQLGTSERRAILGLRVAEFEARARDNGVRLHWDRPAVIAALAARVEGDPAGARGLERLIEHELVGPIARALIDRRSGDPAAIDVEIGEDGTIHAVLARQPVAV